VGECCALTWDRVHLDAEDAYIFIDRGKTKRATRNVPLTQEARKILMDQKMISRSNFVFVRHGDRVRKELWYKSPVSRHTISAQFRDRRNQLGLRWDAVLHSTRHTALTDLGAAGADVFTIKQVAGHASVTTSERYVHPVSDTVRRAIEKLEGYRRTGADPRGEQPETSVSSTPSATISATQTKAGSAFVIN
jgi:integrase